VPSAPGNFGGASMVQLDGTNLRLLELLQDDARRSIIDLARSVDRAESTVRERIAALEREGLLLGYRALVDPEKLGFRVRAVVRAGCDRKHAAELARKVAAIPQVVRADLTSGPKPLVIEVMAENLVRLEQVLEERLAALDLVDPEVEVVLRPLVPPRALALRASPAAAAPPPPTELPETGIEPLEPLAQRPAKGAIVLPGATR
jgi:Lrp/AsnC family leucine-responsive transcriptional regulator